MYKGRWLDGTFVCTWCGGRKQWLTDWHHSEAGLDICRACHNSAGNGEMIEEVVVEQTLTYEDFCRKLGLREAALHLMITLPHPPTAQDPVRIRAVLPRASP